MLTKSNQLTTFAAMRLRVIFLAMVCVVVSACGNSKIDSEFQPYVDEFYKEAELRGVNVRNDRLTVHFGETVPGATAQCVLYDSRPGMGGEEIIVNKTGWSSFETDYYKVEREILMFHELGHCLLGREHEEATLDLCDETNEGDARWYSSVPVSIMKKNNFIEPSIYRHLRSYFMDQLFVQKISLSVESSVEFITRSTQKECQNSATK